MVVLSWYQKERLYSIDVADAHVPHRLHVFLTSLAYHTLYSQNWAGLIVKNSQAWCYTSCSCLELCVGAWLCCNTKKFRKHCCHIPVFIVWATDTLADRWVILKSHGLRFGRSNSGKCCGYVGSVRLACGSVIKCLLSHRFATLGVGDFGPGPGASLPPFGMLTRIRTCKIMHPDSMPFQQKVWDTFGTPMLTQWDRIFGMFVQQNYFFFWHFVSAQTTLLVPHCSTSRAHTNFTAGLPSKMSWPKASWNGLRYAYENILWSRYSNGGRPARVLGVFLKLYIFNLQLALATRAGC